VEASALHAPAYRGRRHAPGPLLRLRSDEQLVARFRLGHDDAFGAIHDRYRQRLFAYTRQMLAGSRSDAEDALQDVFLRAYRALREDDRPITLRAWLYRVAHNRCVDQLRRPLPDAGEVFDVSRTPLRDPLDETERREELRRLVADVRRLPDQQRSALLMRELDGLSYAELAGALDVTVPAVKSLLVRARIGLVEAGEARDAACADIRADLALACRRGVRLSGRSRRHLRDCAGCRGYRHALRGMRDGFGALGGGHGALVTVAKLLGLGGAGSGAAFGGGAAAVGGGAAAGAGAATATKVAAIVCCAAVVGGGTAEVRHTIEAVTPDREPAADAARAPKHQPAAAPEPAPAPAARTAPARAPAPAGAPEPGRRARTEAARRRAAMAGSTVRHQRARVPAVHPTAGAISAEAAGSGGVLAPAADVLVPATETAPAAGHSMPSPADQAAPAASPAPVTAVAEASQAERPAGGSAAPAVSRPSSTGGAGAEDGGAVALADPASVRRAGAAVAPARRPAATRRQATGHGRAGERARGR
jgi:RNA polymerase sigma factor (sigma-70 family)